MSSITGEFVDIWEDTKDTKNTRNSPIVDVDNTIRIRLKNGNYINLRIVYSIINKQFGLLLIEGTPKLFIKKKFEMPITRKALVEHLRENQNFDYVLTWKAE